MVPFLHTPVKTWVLAYQCLLLCYKGELIVAASLWLAWMGDVIKAQMIKT